MGKWRNPFWWYAAAILVCAGYLVLKGLDNSYFWDDEGITAITARNFLKTGHFTGWDGRNLLAYGDGNLLDSHLSNRNPPMQHLLCALGFSLFGESTWAGRFPFAIIGLVALFFFALILRDELGEQSPAAWYALAAFALSPVFLLFSRQCCYYAPAMLFAVLTYWAGRRCAISRRIPYAVAATISAVCLFYTHYLMAAAFLISLAVLFLLRWSRGSTRRDRIVMGVCAVAFLAATVPYAIMARIWDRPDLAKSVPLFPDRFIMVWWYLRDLNLLGCLPWMLLPVLICALIWKRAQAETRVIAWWCLLGATGAVITSILAPIPVARGGATISHARYLVVVAPFIIAAWAGALGVIHRAAEDGWIAAVGILVFALCTTVFEWTPRIKEPYWLFAQQPPARWLLPAYISEIHHPYPTAVQETVEYLSANAQQDDTVHIIPPHMSYGPMFYLGSRMRLCSVISRESHIYETVEKLDAPLIVDRDFPDWIVSFGGNQDNEALVEYFARPVEVNGTVVRHEYELEYVGSVGVDETNRPELFTHSFVPLTGFGPGPNVTYIFHMSGIARVR